MRQRFEGRVAIISGAAGGIGLATAKALAAEGGKVALLDLSDEKLKEALSEVKPSASGAARAFRCDVSKAADVERAVNQVMKDFDRLDVIVNNAGLMISKPIVEHTLDDWINVLSVDLLGAFFFIKHGFKVMKPGSCIVNVSSIHALETTANVASYAAAKAALLSLTRSASIEGKNLGIRVNAILPGAISTSMLWENPNVKEGLESIHMSDVGQPKDVASAIAFLASDESRFIQGSTLRVDGGRLAVL